MEMRSGRQISTSQLAAGRRSPWTICRIFKATLPQRGWCRVRSERPHRPSWISGNDRENLDRWLKPRLSPPVPHVRFPRGIYTGCMGYVSPGPEACFNVATRTADC